MTTSLTDRYVAATVRHVGGKHRGEIERELRAAIADDVEARVELGEEPGRAELAALTELGDPAHLATRYADRATVLIGPRTYPTYKRFLGFACVTVLPVVYLINSVVYWARGENAGTAIFGPIGVTLNVAVYLLVGVTLLFFAADRVAADHDADEGEKWTPEQLPFADLGQQTTWSELIAGSVFGVALIVAIFVQRSIPATGADGVRAPVLDPGLFGFWAYYFVALVVLAIALAVVNLRLAKWTVPTAVAGSVLAVAAAVPLIGLFWQSKVINRALDHGTGVLAAPGSWISWLAAVLIVLGGALVLNKTWRHNAFQKGDAR